MESARLETPAQYEHLRRIKDAIPVAYSFRQTRPLQRGRGNATAHVLGFSGPLERDLGVQVSARAVHATGARSTIRISRSAYLGTSMATSASPGRTVRNSTQFHRQPTNRAHCPERG